MEENITISTTEYKELLISYVRVSAFMDFVKSEKSYISREDCGRYLGFGVSRNED